MLPHFVVLKGLFKLDSVKIDTTLFRLHYKLTVIFLAASCILVTLKQYVGDPINCFTTGGPDKIHGKVLDTYCWIHSTYTFEEIESSNPGVNQPDTMEGLGPHREGGRVRRHSYYQWVGFVLLFQAVLFYLPRWIWKRCDAGRMKELVAGLTSPIAHQPDKSSTSGSNEGPNKPSNACQQQQSNSDRLVNYLVSNLGQHNFYASSFFLCEILNLVNVTGQVYFMDDFFNGRYTTDGISSIENLVHRNYTSAFDKFFPKVGKCIFNSYGASGGINYYDAFCVLPINIINEKIFIFMMVWLTILAALSALGIVYRMAILLLPCFRSWIFRLRYPIIGESRTKKGCHPTVSVVLSRCGVGDWFLLRLIGDNVNHYVFQDVLQRVADRLRDIPSRDIPSLKERDLV